MSNTPNIRFKGFPDSWEQRKLGDVSKITSGFMGDSMLSDGTYHLTRIETIADGVVDENRVGYSNRKPDDTYLLNKGDILYSNINSISHMGKVAKYQGKTALYHGINLLRLEPTENVDSDFLLYLLNTDNCKNWARTRANQAVSQASINQTLLATQEIRVCSVGEQIQIGAFFKSLDNLINLHQRKCNETKELKKYMLQKMFSQNEKKIPEIRFAGFTDDWGQCMLGELVERYEDPVETPHDGYERLGIRSHAKGTFHSYVDEGKELEAAKMHRVAADKFIVNITFAWEHAVAITDDEDAGLLVSHRFPQFSFRKDLKSHFFKYVMIDKKFREHLALSSPGGAGRNRVLKIDDMLKYSIKFPGIAEQIKIGEYFDNLDTLITLHQRKCDELKNIKKFMLQNMFPTKG